MKKTISFGKHAVYSSRKINAVEVEISLKDREDGKKVFSASCWVWNNLHTDIVMGGQCLDTVCKIAKELKHNALYRTILGLWKRNHLNDMHAGTEAQESAIDQWRKDNGHYDYTEACEYLKSIGLYDDNGYKYGTGRLYRKISDDDMKQINEIFEMN